MPRASVLRAPATRDQADAYRFGLRRMEAALVRGDPVLRHEQVRAGRRAVLAGLLLALLGLSGAAAYALVVPRPDWRNQAVVVGAGSGAMYVVAGRPDRLVPVANLPAARLVLAALRAGGSTDADPGTATPVLVPDATLDGVPRTPTAAVPGAVAVRPAGAVVPPPWAICDEVAADGRLAGTTVLGAAAPPPGPPDPPPGPPPDVPPEAVLLDGPDGTWLVVADRRHRVETGDGRVLASFGLARAVPRAAAAALLSVLPEGPALGTPTVPGRGGLAPSGLPGRIGDVLVVRPVDGGPEATGSRFFVVLAGGLQEVPGLVAELLRVASGAREVRPVGLEVVAAAAAVEELPVAGWPTGPPRLRDAADAPVVCWTWAADGGAGGEVWIGGGLPVPAGAVPVALAQADGAGERVDAVAVGAGGAVRATGPDREAGPVWLVSATGVGYRVADDATAAALGITAAEPAPEPALRLLPAGRPLDLAEADRVVDVLPAG